uniref:Terpene synthase metal-binding domain-containing protein n=1 Tax=Salix viminalis TaxID=40686 RepID=A0A6N2L6X3_SALVM
MALTHFATSFCTLPTLKLRNGSYTPVSSKNYRSLPPKVRCMVATEASDQIVRRSANYQSSTWEYDFVQSLTRRAIHSKNQKAGGRDKHEAGECIETLDQLELIDTLQDLTAHDLYAIALNFDFKQHEVPEEVFNQFMDEQGNFRAWLHDDLKGMLYLYEASHLLVEGESILDDARDFTAKNLENMSRSATLPNIFQNWWWKSTGLGEKLDFARDRLMENFFWTVGIIFEPQCSNCRRILAKVHSFITIIDDVYDVYGTLDELELFTDAIVRENNTMVTFQWAGLCKSYLVEAKWYYIGYTPSLREYLDNAWVSSSAPVILVHAYFYVSSPTAEEASHFIEEYLDIIRWSSMIIRLADDLGTSSYELKRGDVSKSIQCYMYETEVFEEKARDHVKILIGNTWKKINDYRFANPRTSQTFIGVAMNLARMAQCMYQYGDGHGVGDLETKDRVKSILIKPL